MEARILLDSEAIRAAIGIGGRHVDHREILIEMGPLEALVKISDTRGPHPCRLDMLAMDRAALGPPAGPIALELCRNAEVVARGRTGPDGRLSLPIKTRGAFRLMFQGAGLRRTDVRIEI